MKINKLIIVIFLLLGYYTSYSQAPGDPSCYTGVYGCVSWSNWVPHTEYMKFQQFGNCQLYAIVYTRYCINDPNNIEMFIYQFGCIPPTLGENCQYFRQSLFPNWPNEDVVNYDFAQTVQMAM